MGKSEEDGGRDFRKDALWEKQISANSIISLKNRKNQGGDQILKKK